MHVPGTPHTVHETVCCGACEEAKRNNPDPIHWDLLEWKEYPPFLLMRVLYTNIVTWNNKRKFEAEKILVLKDVKITDFLKNKRLDPHFDKDGNIVARFMPTDAGWQDGQLFCMVKTQKGIR